MERQDHVVCPVLLGQQDPGELQAHEVERGLEALMENLVQMEIREILE